MSASYPTKILLAMRSGERCALPECRVNLTCDGVQSATVVIGQAAHIYGEREGSARYNENMTDDSRNHYDNLMYLCPTCHTKIDKQIDDYTAEKLIEFKKYHEGWVSERLDESMSEVSFAELEIAAKAIASGQHFVNGDFHVITPEEKIQKNGLTQEVRVLISTGLSRSSEVSDYLVKASQLDAKFPERLKDGFKGKYLELRQSFSGDSLFMAMFEFAKSGQQDFKQHAASLAILTHLFHLCEVFEK
jgi:hypothetical protein